MAQNGAPAVRIVNAIDEKQLVTLNGTVHPLANAKNDRGAAPDSTPLNRIHLLLKRSATQQATLDQMIGQLHTPGNPNYHKWLTPDQFGKQFGVSDQDIATVETWLTGHGFNVIGVKPGKQVIEFSGNVGQFRSTFHTQIHQYSVNGESHFSNATNPQIPAALAPVVGGFVSLNNFHAKSQVKAMGKAMYDPSTHTATADWTWGTTDVNFVLAPQDYAVEYDLTPLYTASTPINGSGQTIAIINDSNVNIDLVNQFRKLFGLSVNPPQVIIDGNDPGVNGDAVEAYLDVEWAGAVAPNATVDLVIGADTELESGLDLAAEHAVFGNVAPVMSMSFGYCEQGTGSNNSFWNSLWEQAAAQGVTAMVSSGDAGSAGCDDDNTQYYAISGQAVNGFASTPYNVAVGGTDFYYTFWNSTNVTTADFTSYWTITPQATPAASLKGYLAEQPWNDSQFGDDLSQTYANSGDTATSIAAGSGGASNCATGTGATINGWTTCTAGYAKPSWQVATGVPADNVRDLPDVSLFASNGVNYSFYPICAEDGDCQPATSGNVIQIYGVGGTSASSPSFAGMMALVNQKYGPQGQANYVLYPMAKQFPAAFHDVTEGSNTVPCDLSDATPNCIAAPSALAYSIDGPPYGLVTEGEIGTGTTPEYNATVGYDLASGLGTIDANQMVTNWGSVRSEATTTTLTVAPPNGVSLSSIPHGTTLTVSGTVTGKGTPTGDVALVTNSTEPINQGEDFFTLSSGAYSGTLNFLPGGTYDVWTQYGGDGTDALSTSSKVSITVTPENSEVALSIYNSGSLLSSGSSISYGTQLTLDALAGPASCATSCPSSYTYPSGTVTFYDNGTAINTATINAEGDAEFTLPNTFNAGSHNITATYSGDGSYNSSTAAAIPFTVTQATTEVLISSPYTSYFQGMTETLSVLVEGLGNGVAPAGTVKLTGAPTALSSTTATLAAGVDPSAGTTVGIATFTIPSSATAGNYSITAAYTPTTAAAVNYAASNSTATPFSLSIVAASGTNTTTTGSATASATSPNAQVTVSGTVTAASGAAPTGSLVILLPILSSYTTSEEGELGSVALTAGTGSSSTFSFVVNSGVLLQGANQLTLKYDPTSGSQDNPSTAVVTIANSLADFSLIANTTIIPVTSGSSASTNINVSSVNTFAGAVDLTCTAPSNWTCTIPSSEPLTNGGFAVAGLSVTAPKTATVGSYTVLITGKDAATGEYVHTLGLKAQVTSTAPGFALTNSGSVTVLPGATTGNTSTITATPSNGFTGAVNLTCVLTNPPGGITAPSCTVTSSVTISGTTAATGTLTMVTTSSTTPGAYTMTVTGKDAATGLITSSTAVGLTVSVPPSIALTNSGAISFQAGASTGDTATITITPAAGFTGNVGLTCVVTPTAAVSPATCSAVTPVDITGTTAGTSTVTVSTTLTTTPGTYTATVTGADVATGKITSSTGVGVTVTAPPTPAITLSNSGSLSFVAGATSGDTATITVTPSNAFTGVVDLTCSVTTAPASPTSPATCSVTPTVDITGTGALTGTLTVTTTSTTTTGAYGITVTGKDAATGKVSSSTIVSVTVNAPPSFALTNNGAVSFQAGATTGDTATVTVTPAGGFTGNVGLTCVVTPTAAVSPATCSAVTPVDITGTTAGTSTVTVTTTLTTTPGKYTATVTGTSGSITASTPVSVTVTAPPPPAIALASSGAISFVAGATTGDTATITVTPSYGFTGVVDLTCAATTTPASASTPATCTVTPTVDITGTSALTGTLTVVTSAATTTGAYVFTVSGKDGTVTGSTTVSVTVNAPPSFALTNSGAISFPAGATTGDTATITVTPAGGFTGIVDLTCAVTNTPASPTSPATCSVTSTVNPTSANPVAATVTVNTTYTTTLGNYTVAVTGKDAATGKLSSTTNVTATVTAPPPPAIALTNSGALSFVAGAATGDSGTVTVTPSYGFTGVVDLTCAVTPVAASSPATCTAGPTVDITGTGAQTSTVMVTTTASTTPGSYSATVTGKDAATGKVTGSTAVGVTVLGVPSFTLSNNGPITFGVGATSGNTATITVAPVNAFTSTVGLTCAVTTTPSSPTSPATCSLAASTVPGGSGTDVLTIGTTSTTTTGNYAITVTGVSGAITGTTVVNVTVNGSYTVTATSPASIAPGASATSTVTIASTNGYAGSVTLTCALTSSPSGATDLPSCTNGSQTVTLSSTTTTGTATVTVDTTAASSSELVRPKLGPGKGWMGAGGGAVLALLLFFGIPARRRSWRSMLGMLVLMVVLGTMAGCGGSGGGGSKNLGTTAGTYTFTITATGNPAQGSGNTNTFTVDVN